MVDLLWSPRLTKENFSRYIELQNFEETARGTGPERSILIACYHYSNFEWLSLACGFLDLKGTIISQEFKNSLLDPIFKKLREQSGHELVPRERGIVRLYKVLRRKGRTALLVDLRLSLTYARIRRPGSGCTSTGAIFPKNPIDLIHFTQISIGRLKTCFHATTPMLSRSGNGKGVRRGGERLDQFA
jgi:hypothetical protein